MNLLKKILIHILIIIIILMSCLSIYFANKHGLNIYAAVNDDAIYVPLRSQSDAVIAFQSYCKSRDLTIEGSLTDAVTTFTTGAFNSACNEIGIDITQLQAEIKAEYDSSGKPVKFFFNDTGVMAMNRIFSQFLQDNELEVGDIASQENNTVYSGDLFTDADGYSCLVYYVTNPTYYSSSGSYGFTSSNLAVGTPYKYDTLDLLNNYNGGVYSYTYHFNSNQSYTLTISGNTYTDFVYILYSGSATNSRTFYRINTTSKNVFVWGVPAIVKNVSNDKYYFARIGSATNQDVNILNQWVDVSNNGCSFYPFTTINDDVFTPVNVFLTTNNTVINNNNYEGDTYITNEGDVINEGDNNNYNPYPDGGGPTTPSTGIGDGNGTQLTLPDLDLNLPSINWSIGDLSEKFPFSIPFDLIAFLTILNAEPETPEIQGNLNLAIVNWEFDYDLHQFDDLASLLRNLEFIGFCIGLVLITRSLLR